jgi:hypothetical protein
MSQPASYASLNASMLARKGEARPSQEPLFGSKPWQPPVIPAAVSPVSSVSNGMPQVVPQAPATASSRTEGVRANILGDMKVKLQDVVATWPQAKPVHEPDNDGTGWISEKHAPVSSFGQAVKTTIKLTHAQARAVKLAALVLDRPQQEILTGGLLAKLEALACSDLSSCTCFKAVIEGLKTVDPLLEPPLAY